MRARTFTESGRRAQIVSAAIEVIAEIGYAKASFGQIAKHAGLSSTGMISYHFADQDDTRTVTLALTSGLDAVVVTAAADSSGWRRRSRSWVAWDRRCCRCARCP